MVIVQNEFETSAASHHSRWKGRKKLLIIWRDCYHLSPFSCHSSLISPVLCKSVCAHHFHLWSPAFILCLIGILSAAKVPTGHGGENKRAQAICRRLLGCSETVWFHCRGYNNLSQNRLSWKGCSPCWSLIFHLKRPCRKIDAVFKRSGAAVACTSERTEEQLSSVVCCCFCARNIQQNQCQ